MVNIGDAEKPYSVAFVGRLELVDEDDFRALSIFERERIARLAEEDPEELVQLVLATLGKRMELRRLKLYLAPLLSSWNKWWARARGDHQALRPHRHDRGQLALAVPAQEAAHPRRAAAAQVRRSIQEPVQKLAMALHVMQEARDHGSPEPAELQPVIEEVAAVGRGAAGRPAPGALRRRRRGRHPPQLPGPAPSRGRAAGDPRRGR